MKKLIFVLGTLSLISSRSGAESNLSAPSNLSSPSNTSCSITIAWCNTDTPARASRKKFTTANKLPPQPPNIVMILLDDARYDAFKPTGGPSYLNYTAIDRIAGEGVNFKYMMPTSSSCSPSRGTILTGLYAHKHGALFNGEQINDSLPQIQRILHDNGYFTGVIGKYSFSNQPTGFDWWAVSTGLEYDLPHFYINGIQKAYPGHITDVYTSMLGSFFDSIPANTPFFLMFWPITPHGPTIPRDEELGLYLSETMPFPTNFYQYTYNFPGYYCGPNQVWEFSALETDSMRRIEFQVQKGLDLNVDTILTRLENKGILDSTLVIFTSDNGYLKGEHLMQAKQVALEESIRVPLFMRYPPWFGANTTVSDQIASNMDLAPTILELANIPDTFHMDGISLHKLYDGSAQRKDFFYELCSTDATPPLRAVRSLEYLYVYNFCEDTTEEFYDLVADPLENTNQIFNPDYASLIQEYRIKKDSFRVVFNDTINSFRTCSLSNIQYNAISITADDADLNALYLFPNPSNNFMQLQFFIRESSTAVLSVMNQLGEVILSENISVRGWKNLQLDCTTWLPGMYFITVTQENEVRSGKMMVMH